MTSNADAPLPEELRRMKALAGDFLRRQQRAGEVHKTLRQAVALSAQQIREAEARGVSDEKNFFQARYFLAQSALLQYELSKWESQVFPPVGATEIRALKLLAQEADFWSMRLDQIWWRRLSIALDAKLEEALAGDALEPHWQALGRHLKGHLEHREKLRRFQDELPLFETALIQALPDFEALASLPIAERLSRLAQADVPSLKGMHYRLQALLTSVPPIAPVLATVQVCLLVNPEGESKDRKRSLTDRLRGFIEQIT